MMTKTFSGAVLLLALGLLLPSGAPAAVVGRITQVEGKAEHLKKGQLPATPLKLNDGLETGDVVRTKSLARAQITFVDKSVLTIAPESRIVIEAFMVDESKGKRNVVLQIFQGLALAVVSTIYKSENPNFVVKTHTAIMGVRGTEVGIRLYPNFSEFLDFKGRVRVQSNLPEIAGAVELDHDQGTRVGRGLPPIQPFPVTASDRQQFMDQLKTGLVAKDKGPAAEASGSGESHSDWRRAGGANFNIFTISPSLTLHAPLTNTSVPVSPANVISAVNMLPPTSTVTSAQHSPAAPATGPTNLVSPVSSLPPATKGTSPQVSPAAPAAGPTNLVSPVSPLPSATKGTSPQISPAAPAAGPPSVVSPVSPSPPAAIGPSPPGVAGGGPPSLTGMLPGNPPGQSGTSPGLSRTGPPGQLGTTPGLSGSGPPGQLKK